MTGNDLTKARRQLGLTQVELAKKLGHSERTVQRWEQSDSVPPDVQWALVEIARQGDQGARYHRAQRK